MRFKDIGWKVGNITVKLWPFVYLAVFTAGLLIYHYGFAT